MIIFNSLYYIIQKHDKKEKNVEIDQKLLMKEREGTDITKNS
ncbi:MAG: hypothetical protein RHS_2597 [Robinsoniella sp. RHS]|nr:MAG: hypothetical protein RHS_2597 [Robinsoniella sp. RHS]